MSKMKIGVASENRPQEKRVILLPEDIKGISNVFVEEGAGLGIGVSDEEYKKAKASVVSRKEVYSCDLVVRLKEPNEEELKLMKPGSSILSMLHLPGQPELKKLLDRYKIDGISMGEIKDSLGRRRIEALEDTGRLGMEKGFELWTRLPASRGEPARQKGNPEKCVVKVMGYGMVAYGAIKAAARKFAKVTILNKKDIYEMEKHIPGCDILVNGLNWPMDKRGKVILIKKEMLKLFKKGAVITDLVANPAGQSPIESMHPTSLDNISYEVEGVIHTACWGWPGLDPLNISKRYSKQVALILLEMISNDQRKR